MRVLYTALAALMTAALTPANATAGRSVVIGLPEDYAGSPQELKAQVERLLLSLKAGSSATVQALPSQKTIARVALPDLPRFDNVNVRLRTVLPAARLVDAFIDHAATIKPAASALPSQVLPAISLDGIAENLPSDSGTREVLIVGSAQHDDKREPSFSMKGGRWFSDGLINGSGSTYGTATRHGQLAGIKVHFCVTEQPTDWASPMAAAHIERAWSLFVQEQGGMLSTFTPNLATCFDRLLQGGLPATRKYDINKDDHRLQMLSLERDQAALDTKKPAVKLDVSPAHGPRKRRVSQVVGGDADPIGTVSRPAHARVHASKIKLGARGLPQPCTTVENAPATPKRIKPVEKLRPKNPDLILAQDRLPAAEPVRTTPTTRATNARSTVTPSITRRESIALGAHPGARGDETCLN